MRQPRGPSAGATLSLATFGGGSPLSEEDLRAFEREHALLLPQPYRDHLAETNGGRPERDLVELESSEGLRLVRVRYFLGLERIVAACHLGEVRRALTGRLPADYLAIATTDQADKICVSLRTGAVVHWDGNRTNVLAITKSFDAFAARLSRDASSPTPTSSVWQVRRSR